MNTRSLYIFLFCCCASICFAQDKLFEKYADMDDVEAVYISQKMFDLMSNINSGGLDLMYLRERVDNLQILTTKKKEISAQMQKDFRDLDYKSYEVLMRVKEENEQVHFYIKQDGTIINEMIMLADSSSEYVVIRLIGKFTLQDIQQMAQRISR